MAFSPAEQIGDHILKKTTWGCKAFYVFFLYVTFDVQGWDERDDMKEKKKQATLPAPYYQFVTYMTYSNDTAAPYNWWIA